MPASKPKPPVSSRDRGGAIYGHLREQLRAALIDGAKAGDRVPAERELAVRFGVSPATVSRSLQELQFEGLIERIPGKGTFVCAPAASAPDNRIETERVDFKPIAGIADVDDLDPFAWAWNGNGTHQTQTPLAHGADLKQANLWIISLWQGGDRQPGAHHYWAHRVTSSAERWVQRIAGHTTVTNRAHIEDSQIRATVERMLGEGINSVIFVSDSVEQRNAALWQRHLLDAWEERSQSLGRAGTQTAPFGMVQILFDPLAAWPCDAVRFDGAVGVYQATAHLIKLGHREIALGLPSASQEADFNWIQERVRGFERALQSVLPEDEEAVDLSRHILRAQTRATGTGTYFWEGTGTEIGQQLMEQKRFTAVVAVNDLMARGLIETVRAQGASVPGDFSIVGFDDTVDANQLGLTTVHAPIERMGEVAATLAVRRLSHASLEGRNELILKPSLMVRSTTRALNL